MDFKLSQFDYDRAERTLSANLSAIGTLGETCFGAVEGNRMGLTIHSPSTDNTLPFILKNVVWDERNQIEQWVLVSKTKDLKCVIFNK